MATFYENLAHYAHGMTTMFFVFISILLYQKRSRNSLINFLCRVMMFWAVIFLKDVVYLIDGFWVDEHITRMTVSVDMLCIPVFSMFLFEVVKPGWANVRRVTLMLLPSVLLGAAVIVTDSQNIFNALIIYSNIMAAVIAVLLLRSTANFNRYIKMNYSYTETISISWLRTVVLLLLVLLLIWSVVTWLNLMLGKAIYYFSSVVVFTYIYLHTMRHHVVSVPDMLNPFTHGTTEGNGDVPGKKATKAETTRFVAKLDRLMNEERIYLNPLLTLREVALAIGTNRTYLSEYLNQELKTNFYDYINAYRVSEAEKLLRQGNSLKMEEIAEKCGFNSLSTFRRSFEKVNGLTPAKFRDYHFA